MVAQSAVNGARALGYGWLSARLCRSARRLEGLELGAVLRLEARASSSKSIDEPLEGRAAFVQVKDLVDVAELGCLVDLVDEDLIDVVDGLQLGQLLKLGRGERRDLVDEDLVDVVEVLEADLVELELEDLVDVTTANVHQVANEDRVDDGVSRLDIDRLQRRSAAFRELCSVSIELFGWGHLTTSSERPTGEHCISLTSKQACDVCIARLAAQPAIADCRAVARVSGDHPSDISDEPIDDLRVLQLPPHMELSIDHASDALQQIADPVSVQASP